MGQAKRRGTFEQRLAQAQERQREKIAEMAKRDPGIAVATEPVPAMPRIGGSNMMMLSAMAAAMSVCGSGLIGPIPGRRRKR